MTGRRCLLAALALAACQRADAGGRFTDVHQTAAAPDQPASVAAGGETARAPAERDAPPGTAPALASATSLPAPASSPAIPLVAGLTLVSAYQFPQGDRENTVVVQEVTPEGVTYGWDYTEHRGGVQVDEKSFHRFVRAADLAAAPRMNPVFRQGPGLEEAPGYTAMSLSRAVYNRVRGGETLPFTVVSIDEDRSGALGGLIQALAPYRGTLSLASPRPEGMPVLVNGHRTVLPVLHVHGRFTYQEKSSDLDYWVLADSANPLVLRGVAGPKLFQMVRIDLPAPAAERSAELEQDLERDCRAELPGIYFAFASAELQPPSAPALAAVAALAGRHPDWSLAVEGHTDSIGNPAANQQLSLQRAQAVRDALVQQYHVAAARVTSAGFGATRPRESNSTIEGRARNRRVELVRPCAAAH